MNEIRVAFEEAELDELREQAAAQGLTAEEFVRAVTLAELGTGETLFEEAADRVLRISEELNRRLA